MKQLLGHQVKDDSVCGALYRSCLNFLSGGVGHALVFCFHFSMPEHLRFASSFILLGPDYGMLSFFDLR